MCSEKEHYEMLFSVVERLSPAAARVFKPVIMQRAGVDFDLPIVEAYYKAKTVDGIAPEDVHIVGEKDEWTYPTTRDGKPVKSSVSVCIGFTCKVLKVAGIFGEAGKDIQ
jgi:hypothetical protein